MFYIHEYVKRNSDRISENPCFYSIILKKQFFPSCSQEFRLVLPLTRKENEMTHKANTKSQFANAVINPACFQVTAFVLILKY